MSIGEQTGPSRTPIPRVGIGWVHPFLEILQEFDVPSDEILERADLPFLAVDDVSALVPTANIYRFVELAAKATGLSDLGLQAGHRFNIDSLLPGPERSWTRPGVFRSLKSFIDVALDSSSNVEMWIESIADPEMTTEFFYLGTFGPDHPAFPTVEQFMVALMVRWVRYAAGPAWNPKRVNFQAASVPERAIRRLVSDAEVRCGQDVTSVVFPSQPFRGPMEQFPEKGSSIWRRHRESLDKSDTSADLAGSLRLVLRAYLPDGSPSLQQAARLAGTSVRTLQRRLKDQGTTYSELLEGLRHDLAIYLLRDPDQEASAVSRELGYRDPAIFTRAFRRWTGMTPSQYRRAQPFSSRT